MYITVVAITCLIIVCCLYYYFHSVKDDPNSSTTKSFPLKKYSNVNSDQVENEEGKLRRQIQLGTKVTFQEELNGFKSNSCKYYFQWFFLLLLLFVVVNLVAALAFLFDYIDEPPLGLHSFYQQCGLNNRADYADELRGSTLAWMKKMMLAQMNSYLFLPLFYLMFNILKSFVNWTEIFDKSFPMIGYLFKTDNFFDVRVNVTLNMINEETKDGITKYKVDMRTLAEMSVSDFFGGKQAAKDLFPRILRKHKEREGYAGETGSTCLKKKWPVKRDKYFPFVQTKDPHSSEKHSAISEQINDQIRNRLSSIFGPTYITEDQQGSCAVSSKEYVFGVTFEKMDNGVSFTSSTLNTLCTSQNFMISLTAHFFSLFFFLSSLLFFQQNEKWRILLINTDNLKKVKEYDNGTVHSDNVASAEKIYNAAKVEAEMKSAKKKWDQAMYPYQRWQHLKHLNTIVTRNDEDIKQRVDRLGGLMVGKLFISAARGWAEKK